MKVARDELQDFARDIASRVAPKSDGAFLVELRGSLGAGKTTFMQALARELGIEETVTSPTFVVMKSYAPTRGPFVRLVHIDAYRLGGAEELAALRPQEFMDDPRTLVCVEWPERVAGALPPPDMTLVFSSEGMEEGEREIRKSEK